MNYKELLFDKNQEVKERFLLARERMEEIAGKEAVEMEPALLTYFQKTAEFLTGCQNLYERIADGSMAAYSLEECYVENDSFYKDILPGEYEESYANPDYAVETLGEEFGRILSFLYTELRAERVCAFEQDLVKMTILHELFLEIYGMFCGEKVTYKQLRETIYWFLYDYADEWCGWRVREMFDPGLSFATDIIMNSDFNDLRYLYQYGEYITETEVKTARYLNSLSQDIIENIARTFTQGFQRGFLLKGADLSKKETVNIRYHIGFERVIRAAICQFREMGLEPVIYRSACSTLNKKQNLKIGYVSSIPNEQFEYDHRFDQALYLDKRMVDRKIDCMRKAYEEYAQEASGFAGPACFDTFGEEPFHPLRKESVYRLSERQQNLSVDYTSLANAVMNEFINQEELSYTIIAYPLPVIGEKFEEIFREMEKVNNLDNDKYQLIQQRMIDVLDRGRAVRLMGTGENITNLIISLHELEDIDSQTGFENCLADMNIPVGEVFTSPLLKGTTGLLHVTQIYLNGFYYKNLKIWFEDGMVTDYSCDNFESAEEGKDFIKENLLFNRETLPMGEFAIGTNTTAYVMAKKYGILSRLPILVAEKMGPHVALGDTCYSYNEEVPVYNPDGREMIAKENECSMLRNEDPMKAYFNCHTDITIPYEELEEVTVLLPDHHEIAIIIDGKFVLEGTLELNLPLEGNEI